MKVRSLLLFACMIVVPFLAMFSHKLPAEMRAAWAAAVLDPAIELIDSLAGSAVANDAAEPLDFNEPPVDPLLAENRSRCSCPLALTADNASAELIPAPVSAACLPQSARRLPRNRVCRCRLRQVVPRHPRSGFGTRLREHKILQPLSRAKLRRESLQRFPGSFAVGWRLPELSGCCWNRSLMAAAAFGEAAGWRSTPRGNCSGCSRPAGRPRWRPSADSTTRWAGGGAASPAGIRFPSPRAAAQAIPHPDRLSADAAPPQHVAFDSSAARLPQAASRCSPAGRASAALVRRGRLEPPLAAETATDSKGPAGVTAGRQWQPAPNRGAGPA